MIELKTDNNSISCEQLKRMKKAKDAKAKTLLKGVVECARHSKHRHKYAQLIWKLNGCGCIKVSEDFQRMDLKSEKPGLAENFRNVEVCKSWKKAEISLALICPGGNEETHSAKSKVQCAKSLSWLRSIEFSKVAEIAGNSEQPLGAILSRYVCRWAERRAGRINPWADE